MRIALCCCLILIASMAQSATYHVNPKGTGDFSTIQSALEAVIEGDIIELMDGIYTGDGNRDLDHHGKNVTVRSQGGNPDLCIIDCQGSGDDPHRAFIFDEGETNDAVVEGITITSGSTVGSGGGIVSYASSPTIQNCTFYRNQANSGGGLACIDVGHPVLKGCRFVENSSTYSGGAVFITLSVVSFTDCEIVRNVGGFNGGGIYAQYGGAVIALENCRFIENSVPGSGGAISLVGGVTGVTLAMNGCTLVGNSSGSFNYGGGAMDCIFSTVSITNSTFAYNESNGGGCIRNNQCPSMQLENCIIAFNGNTGAIHLLVAQSPVELSCCDLFGNIGGDWVGSIADQFGVNGNIAEDPLFCDPAGGEFTLSADSPCLPGNNSCGAQIGAFGLGCEHPVAVDEQPLSAGTIVLQPNYPNPFNPATEIAFVLPEATTVELSIFDLSGRQVRRLAWGHLGAGPHSVVWEGRDDEGRAMPSGAYLCRLQAGGYQESRKLTLLK